LIIRSNASVSSEEYLRYVICKEFGWDYYTYEAQPPSFLEEIYLFMYQENKREQKEQDKINVPETKKYRGGMPR